jgi:Zn-dependent protease
VPRGRSLGWLLAILVAGGVLNRPFWPGVLQTAVFLAAIVLLTVVRELARFAAGRAVGLRPAVVEIGEGAPLFRVRTGNVLWLVKQTAIASTTVWSPPPDDLPLRARLVLLAAVRPLVVLGLLLLLRALGVPLGWGSPVTGGGALLRSVVQAAEILLMIGLVPFAVRGASVVPFESDGLRLVRLLFSNPGDLRQEFGRYYYASARDALEDQDPARALALCREGLPKYGPPWSDVLRALETIALSRAGDPTSALAQAERELARDLPPIARAMALNNWSWFAFLGRDEANLRLAERRSADAMIMLPAAASVAGTRGAILLWQGRVREAIGLLERAHSGAQSTQAREVNACLLAMAQAASGDAARARSYLDLVARRDRTEGLWVEAESCVRSAGSSEQLLEAARGRRALIVGMAAVDLRDPDGAATHLGGADIGRIEVGPSARGRVQLLLRHDRGLWRLPLDPKTLTWARMLLGRVVVTLDDGASSVAAAEGALSMETQERAYQERVQSSSTTVSSPKGVLFLASLVAFGASMLLLSSWRWLGMIVPVLFVHELGHWAVMRAFGHRDASISFIPFLGAATMTKIPFRKRWEEVAMLLAGPLPGILIGVAILASPLGKNGIARQLAGVLVAINAMNLLPLHPLDGGRILHAIVTAGRPRLDLAFKTGAAILFLACGLALNESVLCFLGVFGLLFWRQAWRVAELERKIRSTPGFDPRLPPKERRAYVFRVLAHEPALKAKDWASTVASLEMPLGYRSTPPWQIGIGALLVVACVVGTGLLGRRALNRRTGQLRCPTIASARLVSCAEAPDFTDVDWKEPRAAATKSAAPPADEIEVGSSFAAFVWCSASGAAAVDLATELEEAEIGGRYCQALPWERSASGADEVRRKARWTLLQLKQMRFESGAHGLERFDRRVAAGRSLPQFDAETARLLREIVAAGPQETSPARDQLAERLGRSPSGSCDGLEIHNVRRPGTFGGTDGAVSFAVTMKATSEFGPLGSYLCQKGCQISLLPAAADDLRVSYCH